MKDAGRMTHLMPDAQVLEVRHLLHAVNDELSIAVMQLEMMLENGTVEAQSREALEESLDACRKAAASLKQVWIILGPRSA
jgi:hypothetical protein